MMDFILWSLLSSTIFWLVMTLLSGVATARSYRAKERRYEEKLKSIEVRWPDKAPLCDVQVRGQVTPAGLRDAKMEFLFGTDAKPISVMVKTQGTVEALRLHPPLSVAMADLGNARIIREG